jgi:hypothetical protein
MSKRAGKPPRQARSLLLSQLRPLLRGSQEGSAPDEVAAGPVGCLLRSQLIPVSQLKCTNFEDNGLSFRDEEGNPRSLHKIGQLVQAVLRWRHQRLDWQRSQGLAPSGVDKVLMPRLELVFSKKYNNLVLRLVEEEEEDAVLGECPQYYREYYREAGEPRCPVAPAAPAPAGKQRSGGSGSQKSINPAATADEGTQSGAGGARRRRGSEPRRGAASSSPTPHGPVTSELGPTRWYQPRPQTPQPAPRSRSEPPQPNAAEAEVFDDPFEPPPQIPWGPAAVTPAAAAVAPPGHSGACQLGTPAAAVTATRTEDGSAKEGWPCSRGRAPSSGGRARSLSRRLPGPRDVRDASGGSRASEPPIGDGIGASGISGLPPRSRSEPPQQGPAVDPFDDPFEPPPQKEFWSTWPLVSNMAVACPGAATAAPPVRFQCSPLEGLGTGPADAAPAYPCLLGSTAALPDGMAQPVIMSPTWCHGVLWAPACGG